MAVSTRGNRLERRLLEAYQELWDTFVDPREAYDDAGGGWLPLGADDFRTVNQSPFHSEQQHREIRTQCRVLAVSNEYAINGHENRISYLVGSGHTYRATAKKNLAVPQQLPQDVQAVIDDFVRRNRWHRRQQEIVRRYDRDGEVFVRMFVDREGLATVRFVEPGQVATPPEHAGDPAATFGVVSEHQDVESVLGYYIDGQFVDASGVQHRKANVDVNVKRGLPLFYPVRKNLRRAEKLLRNMSVVAEIQSAIALIRKHHGATRTGVQQFAAGQADFSAAQPGGKTTHVRYFGPGTILDTPGGIEYDFPASGLDASNYVTILQAELCAIASRLVMPEFMLTSDASNANYASTMVAEGPAMRMFSRLQAELIADDLELMWQVVRGAAASGRLDPGALELIEIQVAPPSLHIRDAVREAQVMQIEYDKGILSAQTWSQLRGFDYDQEQRNRRDHAAGQSQQATPAADDAAATQNGLHSGQKVVL